MNPNPVNDSHRYHSVIPENLKASYTSYDNVDFVLSFPGRSLNIGSVCLEGELEVHASGALIAAQDIRYNPLVGAHSFFESLVVSANNSVLENLTEYPRYVSMGSAATMDASDAFNSENVCELKVPFARMSTAVLKGETTPTAAPTRALYLEPDFSIKPLFCLNSGVGALPFRRSGDIRVTANLARVFGALYGLDVDGGVVTYKVKDFRLTFTTTADDGSNDPVVMKTKLNIKASVQSSFANIQTQVPAICTAMTASFQIQENENTGRYDNLALNAVPNLAQTQFLFNDSSNTLISYIIKENSELQDRAIDSMMDTGKNQLSTQKLANNEGFLVGLDFDAAIDLSQQKFSLQLTSSITSNLAMIVYMYFHSQISL